MNIYDYCWNCGNPYYEKKDSRNCDRCDGLSIDKYRKIKEEYINNLLSGKIGSEAIVK